MLRWDDHVGQAERLDEIGQLYLAIYSLTRPSATLAYISQFIYITRAYNALSYCAQFPDVMAAVQIP